MKARIETKLMMVGTAVTATWILMCSIFGASVKSSENSSEETEFEFITGASYAISDCPQVITGYENDIYIPGEYLAKGSN